MAITTNKFPHLAGSTQLGALTIRNKTIMASLTRNRSVPTTIPNDVNVEYYTQRAKESGAGLILSEGTLIAQQGTEWPHAPGIWDEEHAAGWKKVTDAVHAEGNQIVAQLWHTGRVCHTDMDEQKKSGDPVWGPSNVPARGGEGTFRHLPGKPGHIVPTALPDPTYVLDQYTHAAKMAKLAGFDGVEIHSANGYLIDQFLSDIANIRTDKWGGSVENRIRFGLEAVKRAIDVWGADRVGIKLSPGGGYNDAYNSTKEGRIETFKAYITELDTLGLAYIQLSNYNEWGDPKHGGVPQGYALDMISTFGDLLKNTKFIVNGDYTAESAEKVLAETHAEAVVFGRAYIGNPDFYQRVQEGTPLNEDVMQLYYGGKDGDIRAGYTDYPFSPEVFAN
ncbi:hypothetical protein CI109_102778 [Kwoniella shandongensis]|uniref:Uncharacterized protein n=1 Tax=Kwoniella shandongensis TaxID=1734106 RepID=A0A5M6BV24_9TREE|nr:uncharacterized protein CI109_004901 [Kwoniella shandongensis]KAA5526698.1 hypothetical protein CI109_004901 [Kwoniella shandongensis]